MRVTIVDLIRREGREPGGREPKYGKDGGFLVPRRFQEQLLRAAKAYKPIIMEADQNWPTYVHMTWHRRES